MTPAPPVVEWQTFAHPHYQQPSKKKHALDSHLSILDLIAIHGATESMAILRRGCGDSQLRQLASDNT